MSDLIRCLAEYGHVADAIKLLMDYIDAVRQGDLAGKFGIASVSCHLSICYSNNSFIFLQYYLPFDKIVYDKM